jgi:hypothetical protein
MRCRDVDDFEDAEIPRFNLNPRRSTRRAQTAETKVVENRRFRAAARNCLGRRGADPELLPQLKVNLDIPSAAVGDWITRRANRLRASGQHQGSTSAIRTPCTPQ